MLGCIASICIGKSTPHFNIGRIVTSLRETEYFLKTSSGTIELYHHYKETSKYHNREKRDLAYHQHFIKRRRAVS